jgi:GTPase SAR1 family protein
MRFIDGSFTTIHQPTTGNDLKIKNINMEEKLIKLQILDAPGKESLRNSIKPNYKVAHSIILNMSITITAIQGFFKSYI